MRGDELATRLVGKRPETAVLYISGYTDGTLDTETASATGGELLPKPFTPDALARKVRELLDARGAAAP